MTWVMPCRWMAVAVVLVWLGGAAAMAQELRGSGEWQSDDGESMKGSWQLKLNQAGDQLSGTIELDGSNVLRSADVQGTIRDNEVTIGVVKEGMRAVAFTGRRDGKSIAGEWSFSGTEASGVWFGQLSEAETALPSTR